MKSAILLCLPFVILSVTLAVAQAPSTPQPAQIIKNYKKLTCLTPEGYPVDPDLAALCIGASSQQVAQAERKKGPHAFGWVRVYVDSSAKKALTTKAKMFPVGAIIVKEKYHASQVRWPQEERNKRRNGVTGMIKRAPGYDPQNGDWEYFIQEEGGKMETGKITTCVSCHQKAKGPDHLFATWYKPVDTPHGRSVK